MRYDEYMDSDFFFDQRERSGFLVIATAILAANSTVDPSFNKAIQIVDKVEEYMKKKVKAEYEKYQKEHPTKPQENQA